MTKKCLSPFRDVGFKDFLKYLLNRFGHEKYRKLPSVVKKKHIEYWGEHFDLKYAVASEHDFLGEFFERYELSSGKRKQDAYFSTPESIVELKTSLLRKNSTIRDLEKMHDPCCGSGRQLLAASNYCLFLYGQDVEEMCVLITLVNGFLFAPQIVCPPPKDLGKDQKNWEQAQFLIKASQMFDFLFSDISEGQAYKELMQFLKRGSPERIFIHENPRFISLQRFFGLVKPHNLNKLEKLSQGNRRTLLKAFESFWQDYLPKKQTVKKS